MTDTTIMEEFANGITALSPDNILPEPMKRKPSIPIYPGINGGHKKIRLMELLPGDVEGRVACKFQTTSLSDDTNYDCLSYVWGHSGITSEIIVDGVLVEVTSNLENALRHIRRPTESRIVWVDALCINQADHQEKTRQVRLMGDIYRNAQQGILWLGDFETLGIDSDHAAAVKEFVHLVLDKEYMETLPRGNLPCLEENCYIFYKKAFGGLRQLLKSTWWTRIWTVQEVVLPPQSFLTFGKDNIPWCDFEDAAAVVVTHGWSCCPHTVSIPGIQWMLNEWTSRSFAISTVRDGGELALSAMWRFRDRDATDPRDKVLGILGLIPSLLFESHHPNLYDISVADLYHRLVIALIMHHGSLVPLIGRRGEVSRISGMSSWGIDWTSPPETSATSPWTTQSKFFWSQFFRYHHSQACGTFGLALKAMPSNQILLLDGIYVDYIVAASLLPYSEETTLLDGLRLWRRFVNQHRPGTEEYPTGCTWDEAFYRTMTGDMIMEPNDNFPTRSPHDFERQHFENFMEGEGADTGNMFDSVFDQVAIESLFITQKGYLGIGGPLSSVGDQVWVLGGGNLPLVFRTFEHDPRTKELDVSTKTFEYLGNCYVHGIMHGEAVKGREKDIETVALT